MWARSQETIRTRRTRSKTNMGGIAVKEHGQSEMASSKHTISGVGRVAPNHGLLTKLGQATNQATRTQQVSEYGNEIHR